MCSSSAGAATLTITCFAACRRSPRSTWCSGESRRSRGDMEGGETEEKCTGRGQRRWHTEERRFWCFEERRRWSKAQQREQDASDMGGALLSAVASPTAGGIRSRHATLRTSSHSRHEAGREECLHARTSHCALRSPAGGPCSRRDQDHACMSAALRSFCLVHAFGWCGHSRDVTVLAVCRNDSLAHGERKARGRLDVIVSHMRRSERCD